MRSQYPSFLLRLPYLKKSYELNSNSRLRHCTFAPDTFTDNYSILVNEVKLCYWTAISLIHHYRDSLHKHLTALPLQFQSSHITLLKHSYYVSTPKHVCHIIQLVLIIVAARGAALIVIFVRIICAYNDVSVFLRGNILYTWMVVEYLVGVVDAASVSLRFAPGGNINILA